MNNAGKASSGNERLNLCVIANIDYFKWNIDCMLCAQVSNTWLKALIERIEKYDIFASLDEEVSDMYADIAGATCN